MTTDWEGLREEFWIQLPIIAAFIALVVLLGTAIYLQEVQMAPCKAALAEALRAERWEEARAWAAALENGCPGEAFP